MIRNLISRPDYLAIPLILAGFCMSLFFQGTQDVLYAPQIACLVAAGLVLLIPNIKTGWPVPRGILPVLISAYWAYLFIALQWSLTPYISTYFFFIFSILPFLFFALTMTRHSTHAPTLHAAAITGAIALVAIWALIQFFFLYETFGPRIRHPLLNPNNLAGIFNLGLFPVMALFMATEKRMRQILILGLVILIYTALMITQSRGAILSMIISTLVLLPFIIWPLRQYLWRKVLLLSTLVAVPSFLWFYSEAVHGRKLISAFAGGASASITDRFMLWGSTFAMIREHIWTGTGLGSFSYYYAAHRMPPDSSDGYFAHMDPLQFWAEMGIMAPVLFYAILTAILIRTILAVKAATNNKARMYIMGPFCALLALTLHTHITFHLYMPVILIPVGVLLACWYTATESVLGANRLSFMPQKLIVKRGLIAFLVITAIIATSWTTRSTLGTYYLKQAKLDLAHKNFEQAFQNISKAETWSPQSRPQTAQYGAFWRKMILNSAGDALDTAQKQTLYKEALALIDTAQQRQPSLYHLHGERALIYKAAQDHGLIENGVIRLI